jgi:hypothetical protein
VAATDSSVGGRGVTARAFGCRSLLREGSPSRHGQGSVTSPARKDQERLVEDDQERADRVEPVGSPGRPRPSQPSGSPAGVTSGRSWWVTTPAAVAAAVSGRCAGSRLRVSDGRQASAGCASASGYGRKTGGICRSGSERLGGAGRAGAPPVGSQYRLQCSVESGQVAVVDAAVGELCGELVEQPRPVPAGWLQRDAELDLPFDNLHRGPVGGGGAGLLPGSVAAGGRAPLRDRTSAAWSDRSGAPSARCRRGAPIAAFCWGAGPIGTHIVGRGAPRLLLPSLLLAFPPANPVLRRSARSHGLSVQAVLP